LEQVLEKGKILGSNNNYDWVQVEQHKICGKTSTPIPNCYRAAPDIFS